MHLMFFLVAFILVGILIAIILANILIYFLRFFTKREKFLRVTKYVAFVVIFLLESGCFSLSYIRRASRSRLRDSSDFMPVMSDQRIEQLNRIKEKDKIDKAIYNEALKNIESE